jgi:hypothetical protein
MGISDIYIVVNRDRVESREEEVISVNWANEGWPVDAPPDRWRTIYCKAVRVSKPMTIADLGNTRWAGVARVVGRVRCPLKAVELLVGGQWINLLNASRGI